MNAYHLLLMFLGLCCYTVPGSLLVATLGLPRFFSIEGLVLSFALSSGLFSMIGLALARAQLYRGGYVWLIALGLGLVFSIPSILHFRREKPPADQRLYISKSSVVVWGLFTCIVMIRLFIYGGDGFFPKGHDASVHVAQLMDLLTSRGVSLLELGTSAPKFYFQGLYASIGVLAALSINVPPSIVMEFFIAVVVGAFAPLAFVLTRMVTGSSRTGMLAAVMFLLFSKPFIVTGNYPMALAMFYVGVLLCLLYKARHERLGIADCSFSILLLSGSLITHLPTLQYCLFLFMSITIWEFVFARSGIRPVMQLVALVSIGVASGLAFLYLAQPRLFWGQVSYFTDRLGTAGQTVNWQGITFREPIPELIVWLLLPLLLGPFLIGLWEAFKAKEAFLLGATFAAASVSLIQLLPQTGREYYYLLYPVTCLGAWGVDRLTDCHGWHLGRWIIGGFMSVLIVFGLHQAAGVASQPVSGPSTYLSDSDVEFAHWLQWNFPTGLRIAAHHEPGNLLVEALTPSKMYLAHRSWTYPANYPAMKSLLDEQMLDMGEKLRIICEYKITAVLLDSPSAYWMSFPYSLQYYSPVRSRHLYVLDDSACGGR